MSPIAVYKEMFQEVCKRMDREGADSGGGSRERVEIRRQFCQSTKGNRAFMQKGTKGRV